MITRERDQRDRRRQILTITTAGQRALRKVEKLLKAAESCLLAAPTEQQRAEIHKSATQVLASHDADAWFGLS